MELKETFKNLFETIKEVQKQRNLPFRNQDIAQILGYNRTYISNLLGEKGVVTNDHIKTLYLHFPFLKGYATDPNDNPDLFTLGDSEKSYIEQRRNLKNTKEPADIPVMGGYTNLGMIQVFNDEQYRNEVVATLPAKLFPGSDYGEKAKGDSMYPIIMNQAYLVGKKCTPKGITYGEKYIIKTKDGLDTTKYVHPVLDETKKRIDGKLLLVAHNKSIPTQEIEIDDIVFSCRVLFIINPT